MSCLLNFVFFVILCRKTLSHPTSTYATSLKTTYPNEDRVVELGKGLDHIPPGRTCVLTLNLAYNHLSTLPDNVFYNNSYKMLTKIELFQNRISNISLLAFRGLKRVTSIDLSDNNITTIDPYTFKYNQKLDKLYLSGNRINFDRLQVFLVSPSMHTLIIAQNRIEQIYELTFIGLPNLKNLILDRNPLFLISPNSFKPLNNLQYLALANTGVYRLSESMFNDLPRIIDLQETPLAKRFDPPLKKVANNAVRSLINIDQYIH